MNDKIEGREDEKEYELDEKEYELLDHFAGLAMQALLAAKTDEFVYGKHGANRLAALSYEFAEHMMTQKLKYEADT